MANPAEILPADDLEPWEQQPGEGPEAYHAFTLYRNMGLNGSKRSTAKVAVQCGKHVRLITRWSARWAWVERVRDPSRAVSAEGQEKEIVEFRKWVAQRIWGKAQSLMWRTLQFS